MKNSKLITREDGLSLNSIHTQLNKVRCKNGIYNILQHKTRFKVCYKSVYPKTIYRFNSDEGLNPRLILLSLCVSNTYDNRGNKTK